MASSVISRLYLLIAAIFFTLLFASIVAQGDDYEPEIGPLGHHPGGLGDKGPDHGKEGGDVVPDHGEEGGNVGPDHGEEGGGVGPVHGEEGGGVGPDHGEEGGGVGPDRGKEDGDGGPDHGDEDGDPGPGEDDKDPNVGVIGNDPAHIISQALLCFNEKHIYSKCEESYRLTETGELHVPSDHVDEFCTGPCLEETNLMLHCLDGIMDHFLFFNKATTRDVKDTILAGCSHGGDLDVAEHMKADDGGVESIGSKATVHAFFGIVITIIGHIFLLYWFVIFS